MPKINVYLPADLALEVKAHHLPVSATCQRALSEEVMRMAAKTAEPAMKTLTVETGEDDRTQQFRGHWVIDPSEELRSEDEGSDAGICFAVAHTAKGRIAVYVWHKNNGNGRLDVYDDIEDADLPESISNEYLAARGQVMIRDI